MLGNKKNFWSVVRDSPNQPPTLGKTLYPAQGGAKGVAIFSKKLIVLLNSNLTTLQLASYDCF